MLSRISGTGRCLPEGIVKISDSTFRDRTGIDQFHAVAEGETTADLAEAAAISALASAGVNAESVDLLIVSTTTPDIVFPNLGSLLQERLGIADGPAFSLEASASGFTYALSIAHRFIVSGTTRSALVIGADTLSRLAGSGANDSAGGTAFADGAGAVLLEPAESPGLLDCQLGAVASGTRDSENEVLQLTSLADLEADLTAMRSAVLSMLAEHNIDIDAIDWLIPHQSNREVIERTSNALGIPDDKTITTIAENGSIGAASIPVALDVAVSDGRIKRGDLLLLESVGGGFTWGSALVRY